MFHPAIGEVWLLHRVTNTQSQQKHLRTYEITPHRLESLIKSYLNRGYVFVTMPDVYKRMTHGKANPRFVCITLDDGYADNYDIAYPIFSKYNVPFCIYICKKMITGERREDEIENYRMLTLEQIQQLDNSPLCTIGCHTSSHFHLSTMTKEQQMEEVQDCKEWLQGLLGHKIEDFAYPYGDFNDETLDVLRQVGIKRAVVAWGGAVRKDIKGKAFKIPRLLVTEESFM